MLFSATPYAHATPADTLEFIAGKREFISPRLSVDIPNVTFQSVTPDGPLYSIPWLANYITGVYRYAVSIAGLLAGVMFVVGGFYYLTAGGDASRVQKGKQRIIDALIGLILVMGSYVLLLTINPDLVEVQSLSIKKVERINFESRLGTATADTVNPDAAPRSSIPGEETASAPAAPGAAPAAPGAAPAAPRPAGACPFTFTGTGGSRRGEFYQHVRDENLAPGATVRERVVQIANLAADCDAFFGSCGRTAGSISALAGVGGGSCLTPPSGNCNGAHGRQIEGISATQRRAIYGLRCALDNPIPTGYPLPACTGAAGEGVAADTTRCCVSTSAEARAKIIAYFTAEAAAGRLRNNYPDGWVDQLRPGDYVVVYNGNSDLVGSHAFIFMGFRGSNEIDVVQGGGTPANARRGHICVKSGCGARLTPITYMYSVE